MDAATLTAILTPVFAGIGALFLAYRASMERQTKDRDEHIEELKKALERTEGYNRKLVNHVLTATEQSEENMRTFARILESEGENGSV